MELSALYGAVMIPNGVIYSFSRLKVHKHYSIVISTPDLELNWELKLLPSMDQYQHVFRV